MLRNRLLPSHVLVPCCKTRGCVKTPPGDPAAAILGFPGNYGFGKLVLWPNVNKKRLVRVFWRLSRRKPCGGWKHVGGEQLFEDKVASSRIESPRAGSYPGGVLLWAVLCLPCTVVAELLPPSWRIWRKEVKKPHHHSPPPKKTPTHTHKNNPNPQPKNPYPGWPASLPVPAAFPVVHGPAEWKYCTQFLGAPS